MFAVIYRFNLKSHQEKPYLSSWNRVANYFIKEKGAIGSCLHRGDDGLWVAYSRWPDKATRDNAWPGENAPNQDLPLEIQLAIKEMQYIKQENHDLEQYDEICLDVIEDKLLNKSFF